MTAALVGQFDCLLLDLDGVVYVGPDAVPHAIEALAEAKARYCVMTKFITNNAARTAESVAAQLREIGADVSAEDVVTSAQAAASHLARELPAGSKVLVVGGEGLTEALGAVGLIAVGQASDEPVAVVQGFSPDVGWRNLQQAAGALHTGIPWVASNLDLTLPTPLGLAPGNGSLVNALTTATGRVPVSVGKPERPILDEAIRRCGAKAPLVIGDRLDTDIGAGHSTGLPTLLVLTGVSQPADVVVAPAHQRPTYIGADLRALLEPAAERDWLFTDNGEGEFVLATEGSRPADGLLALATLCWSISDSGQQLPANAQELAESLFT